MNKPNTIDTTTRIFKVSTFDNETFLCNLKHIKLEDLGQIKRLYHMWNFEWSPFGKVDLKAMLESLNVSNKKVVDKNFLVNLYKPNLSEYSVLTNTYNGLIGVVTQGVKGFTPTPYTLELPYDVATELIMEVNKEIHPNKSELDILKIQASSL